MHTAPKEKGKHVCSHRGHECSVWAVNTASCPYCYGTDLEHFFALDSIVSSTHKAVLAVAAPPLSDCSQWLQAYSPTPGTWLGIPFSQWGVCAVIALCGQRQALRRSLGLMAEMRSRKVPANVHTYSALMNVCIKCGELDLALDVFNQLQVWPLPVLAL